MKFGAKIMFKTELEPANIIFHRLRTTKESEDMESLCLLQNRRFHIRQPADDGISVLPFYYFLEVHANMSIATQLWSLWH